MSDENKNWRECGQRIKVEYHKTSKQYLFPFFKKLKMFERGWGGAGSFTAVDKFSRGFIFVNN